MRRALPLLILFAGCASAPGPAPVAPIGTSAPPAPAAPPAQTPPPVASGELGTVHAGAADTWYVTPDGNPGARYCFSGPLVTGPLQAEGARVQFAGAQGPIPPNVRLTCTPFDLTSLSPGQ